MAGFCSSCHQFWSAALGVADRFLIKIDGGKMFTVIKEFEYQGSVLKAGSTVNLAPLQATFCINAGLVKEKHLAPPVPAITADIIITERKKYRPKSRKQ